MDHEKILRKVEAILSKEFDAGQIVVTHRDGAGMTSVRTLGFGNYYARIDACKDFVLREKESSRLDVIRDDEC